MPDPSGASASPVRLADHTTLRLGGRADAFVAARSDEEIIAAVDAAQQDARPVLVLGGGSNLVVADEGFAGIVVALTAPAGDAGVRATAVADGRVEVTVAAGVVWDDFVARAVAEGWAGVEALSGIPGTVGATPVQNVGAYGQEVAQTITSVRVWDRRLRGLRTFAADDCGFGYRTSRFKLDRYDDVGGRHVVLDVTFGFDTGDGARSSPIGYAELGRSLGVAVGDRAPLADVRAAVLALRAGKGMVLDAADHDTWSAGSFFTNPLVAPDRVPVGAPSYDQGDGTVKTSAAWLIEHAGFGKGYGADRGTVGLSTKHTLALTNRGSGTTADLLDLAREIRTGVGDRFGITLVNEPVMVGCAL